MEPYYYQQMNKQRQAVYHAILQGITALADEFQIPAIEGAELYDVFFQLRLDHPEIFGLQDSSTNISKIHRIIFLYRSIFLRRTKSVNIKEL